jgi:DNA helicase-2/ATP-dependent DNA helicase PcrA
MIATIPSGALQPSVYQQAIFDAVRQGEKALVVAAVPGSGKTTTSKELLRYLPAGATVLALAFNVDAARQLQEKINVLLAEMTNAGLPVPLVESKTIHSLGNATLASAGLRSSVRPNKYTKLCRQYLQARDVQESSIVPHLSRLIDVVRLTLAGTDERSLVKLCTRFEIELDRGDKEIWPVVLEAVPAIVQAGITQCTNGREIDYTDMIWLPDKLNLQPRRYDYVLVDEAQDLSPAQRSLVLKARKQDGALIAVGDRNQAIYGFAGASLRSIDEIIEATGARELPLSICYRCPKKVVALAASLYPGIQAAESAPDGRVEYITPDKVASMARPGDLILCRLTAPLVEKCLELLRMGKRANVRGRDLGATFLALLEQTQKFNRKAFSFETLEQCVRNYEQKQIEVLSLHAEENAMKIASLQDKIDTLLALHEAYAVGEAKERLSLDGFLAYVKAFFTEDPGAQIILSTGHRAKGLEYPRVFLLEADKIPHPKAKTAEARTQEYNLMYVMYTRAKFERDNPESGTLFLVVGSPQQSPAAPEHPRASLSYTPNTEDVTPPKKHAGGRPRKDRVRVNIKLDSDLQQLTEDLDRSELINTLLRQHFKLG